MNQDNKKASLGEILIVCVIGIVVFLLNKVDSWFYSMNLDYLHRVVATAPIAVSIEGDADNFDKRLGETKVIKTLKTFGSTGSIWDCAVRDDLLETHIQSYNGDPVPQYVVQHVEGVAPSGYEGFNHNSYIYVLIKGDDANLTKTNEWLRQHHAITGNYDNSNYDPREYIGKMLDHEHDIFETSFTNKDLKDGVEVGKGPEIYIPNEDGTPRIQFGLRVWYKYHGTIYCFISGDSVMMENVSCTPNGATVYNYYPSALLGENP
jgi:hypothetical protein